MPTINKLFHVALIGYPSSGKTEIAERFENAGYRRVANDIRKGVFGDKPPFELTDSEWISVYAEFQVRKHLHWMNSENVVSDNCSHDRETRKLIMHVSPLMHGYLEWSSTEIDRYLVMLDVDIKEIILRNDAKGRNDKKSYEYMEWLSNAWEEPEPYEDEFGAVNVLRYENNTKKEQHRILRDLGKRLGLDLV